MIYDLVCLECLCMIYISKVTTNLFLKVLWLSWCICCFCPLWHHRTLPVNTLLLAEAQAGEHVRSLLSCLHMDLFSVAYLSALPSVHLDCLCLSVHPSVIQSHFNMFSCLSTPWFVLNLILKKERLYTFLFLHSFKVEFV